MSKLLLHDARFIFGVYPSFHENREELNLRAIDNAAHLYQVFAHNGWFWPLKMDLR